MQWGTWEDGKNLDIPQLPHPHPILELNHPVAELLGYLLKFHHQGHSKKYAQQILQKK